VAIARHIEHMSVAVKKCSTVEELFEVISVNKYATIEELFERIVCLWSMPRLYSESQQRLVIAVPGVITGSP
jgi:hypothetical protein